MLEEQKALEKKHLELIEQQQKDIEYHKWQI
jgi:hypothetical protein